MVATRIKEYFLPTNCPKDTKRLNRRAELIGMQVVLTLTLLYTLLAVVFTNHTTVARFRYDYEPMVNMFACIIGCTTVLLAADSAYSMADLRMHRKLTTSLFFRHLSRARPWLLFTSGIWFLILMSVCEVENGFAAIFAYAVFFLGNSVIALSLSLRDGCVDNRLQQEERERKNHLSRHHTTLENHEGLT